MQTGPFLRFGKATEECGMDALALLRKTFAARFGTAELEALQERVLIQHRLGMGLSSLPEQPIDVPAFLHLRRAA